MTEKPDKLTGTRTVTPIHHEYLVLRETTDGNYVVRDYAVDIIKGQTA